MSGIYGKYFSFTAASAAAGTDLISRAEILSGQPDIIAKKLTLVSSASLALSINGLSAYSTLYLDSDSLYKLSLDANDCLVSSLVIGQTTSSPIFLAIVF